jgi:hypothetical protein
MTGRTYVLKYEGDPKKKYDQFRKMAHTIDMDFDGDLKRGISVEALTGPGSISTSKAPMRSRGTRSRSPSSKSRPSFLGSW